MTVDGSMQAGVASVYIKCISDIYTLTETHQVNDMAITPDKHLLAAAGTMDLISVVFCILLLLL